MIVNSVLLDVNAKNWKQAFLYISEQTSFHTPLKTVDIYNHLIDLEYEQSSGVGRGIAIPHIVVEKLDKPYLLIARLNEKIDINAVDGEPVNIIALLLSSQEDGSRHLTRLSRITRLLQNEDIKTNILSAKSESQVYNLLVQPLSMTEAA
jgi:PTS system nitrogen regulatory IIA component